MPMPGTAQEVVVRSARLVAEVPPEAAAVEVRIEYTVVTPGGVAAAAVRLEALGFGPASVEAVRMEGSGVGPGGAAGAAALAGRLGVAGAGDGTILLRPETGSMRADSIALPTAPPEGSDEVDFALAYRVSGAVERSGHEVRVRLPLPVLDLPPEQGGDPVFRASVRLPDGWSVSGSFPTGLARTSRGTWEADLPVVPALVSFRGRSDGAWRPGLSETLDALALIVILGFGLVGWRHLREVTA